MSLHSCLRGTRQPGDQRYRTYGDQDTPIKSAEPAHAWLASLFQAIQARSASDVNLYKNTAAQR
jgi:hypothetical protein